jgi:hypothetical protein
MGLFDGLRRGREESRSPIRRVDAASTLAEELYAFGRYEILPMRAPQQIRDAASGIEPKYYQEAIANPASFGQRVLAAARQRGGWAAYGGMRLLRSLLGEGVAQPTFDEVSELAFAFLRSRNINFMYLSRFEIEWWIKHHPGEDYLKRRPFPPRENWVTPLASKQARRVANTGPTGNNNDIFVVESGGVYQAVIQSPGQDWYDAVKYAWQTAPDLYGIYLEVAEALRSEPAWCDPQLRAFIPLDAPDFSPS